jgi:hypothetical protein
VCNKVSCLGCPTLNHTDPTKQCDLFRASYERKKLSIQLDRYAQARDESLKKEAGKMSEEQIYAKLLPYADKCIDERTGKLSVRLLRVKAKDQEHMEMPISKLNLIVDLMRQRCPELEEHDELDEDKE